MSVYELGQKLYKEGCIPEEPYTEVFRMHVERVCLHRLIYYYSQKDEEAIVYFNNRNAFIPSSKIIILLIDAHVHYFYREAS
jgi:hypothetical protein